MPPTPTQNGPPQAPEDNNVIARPETPDPNETPEGGKSLTFYLLILMLIMSPVPRTDMIWSGLLQEAQSGGGDVPSPNGKIKWIAKNEVVVKDWLDKKRPKGLSPIKEVEDGAASSA
jgi:hypothetical protein